MNVIQRRTTCLRDCPDACGIVAEVAVAEDGSERIVRIGGERTHPVTDGFLCWRTNTFLPRLDDRLTSPLMRDGSGSLAPVSWDAALDRIAADLLRIREESGPAAVFHYRSGGSLGLSLQLVDRLFEAFGPVTVKRGDICNGAGDAAQVADFGVCDSSALADVEHARHVLLWGKNPVVSGPHVIPLLRRARARGAELVLIDPVRHESAKLCQSFVPVRPGGDFALAMAVARLLFAGGHVPSDAGSWIANLDRFRGLCERRSVDVWCSLAGVEAGAAEDLARRLADGPCAIQVGWGMQRRTNGAAIVRALDALAAISGNLGRRGGGVSHYFSRRAAFAPVHEGSAARTVCEPLMAQELESIDDPPIRAVWVTAGNPVAMLPDSTRLARALRARELVVVVDSFLTDTAEAADVVLPCPTFLEADDVCGAYGHEYLGAARPLARPPAGVRSDLEIAQALAPRLGLEGVLDGSPRAWQERLVAPLADRVSLEQLEAGAVRNPDAPAVLFADRRFPTADGRAHLIEEDAPRAAPSADFPLLLMAISHRKSQSAVWSRPESGPLACRVHPDALAAAGLSAGPARLESVHGALEVLAVADDAVHPEVALLPKGGHLRDGRSANALIDGRTTDLGEGGAIYDQPVRLVALR